MKSIVFGNSLVCIMFVPCDSVICLRLVPDFNGRIYKIQRIRFGFVALFETIRPNRGLILCENVQVNEESKIGTENWKKTFIFFFINSE